MTTGQMIFVGILAYVAALAAIGAIRGRSHFMGTGYVVQGWAWCGFVRPALAFFVLFVLAGIYVQLGAT